MALLLVALPFLFYVYKSFPDQKVWETSFFTYDSNYYQSVKYSAHALFSKLIPLCALLIWFFSFDKWWYHAIVPLITMYIFQLIGIVTVDLKYVDEFEFIYVIPLALIVLPVLYITRKKVFHKELLIALKEDIERELQNLEEK